MLLHVTVVGSFLLLCDVPLFKCTIIYSFIDGYLSFYYFIIYVFWWTYTLISLGYISRGRIATS